MISVILIKGSTINPACLPLTSSLSFFSHVGGTLKIQGSIVSMWPMRWALLTAMIAESQACSNILVTPMAALEGIAMIGDNDDSAKRDGGETREGPCK